MSEPIWVKNAGRIFGSVRLGLPRRSLWRWAPAGGCNRRCCTAVGALRAPGGGPSPAMAPEHQSYSLLGQLFALP